MGSSQSYEESNRSDDLPKVIRIERSEIPEEYRTVAVSHDVVDQILNLGNPESGIVNDLRYCLLSNFVWKLSLQKAAAGKISVTDLQARKDAFDETVKRIEKQYFSYQPENVCKTFENDLMECIMKNKNKLLNCTSFAVDMTKCASDFREKVLKEVPHL
uniref:BMA-CHCH-3 n=1 Tax=Brugia malayi TaxID=6279 RepID=A0A0J9XX79_BRUMA|nr:BMA-CHCH-3 [Brugia malayi]